MKNILFYLSIYALMLTIASCTNDEYISEIPVPDTGSNTFSFRIHIPDEKTISTRGEAIQPGVIENLYVLLFDPEGTFLTRARAESTSTPGEYTVELSPTDQNAPQEERKRIIHFVCNYDWSDFSDVNNIGKHENEVIAPLSVTGGKTAYWQRIELANGITEGIFPDTIELLRNMAKISVNNNSILNRYNSYITDAEFALGDYYDYGTIAPFNTATFAFEEGAVCESLQGTIQPVTTESFVGTGGAGNTGKSVLCYERRNSVSDTPMYIILKGKYSIDGIYYYYKVDIIDEGQEVLYDITRNNHYIIGIQRVSGPGYKTLQEAVNSPASNNLLYSVVLQDYTAISDGQSALKVEMISKTIVQPDKELAISFRYIPDITNGIEDNTLVTIELQQDPNSQVIDPTSQVITTTPGNAVYKARTVSTLPEYEIYTAKLVFKATYNNYTLHRAVSLRFRQPSVFEQVSISPSSIPATIGGKVELHFTIPSNIRSDLFPMEVFITTLSLTPNLDYNNQDKLTLDYQKPGTFRYKYIVRDTGNHTLHFKTTSQVTNETLNIESELFTTADVILKN